MDLIDIGGIVAVCINYFIYIPLIIYLYLQYRKHSNEPIMRYRQPLVLNLMYFFLLVTFLIERWWPLLTNVWCIISAPKWMYSLFSSLTFFCYHLFAIKCYHLHYQQQYHLESADMSWKMDLNPEQKNWFIEHKNTLGNAKKLIQIALIPYTISIIIETINSSISQSSLTFNILYIIILFIPLCFAYYSFWKTRNIDDIYGIHTEIRYQVIAETIANITMILWIIISRTIPLIYNYSQFERLQYLLYVILFTPLYLTPLIIFNTAYPLLLHKKTSQNKQPTGDKSLSRRSVTNSISNMTSIIKDYKAFTAFMRYLVTEFSTENLLFLVELVMVKHKYQTQNNNVIKIPKHKTLLKGYHTQSMSSMSLQLTPALELGEMQKSLHTNDTYMTIDFNISTDDLNKDSITTGRGNTNTNNITKKPAFLKSKHAASLSTSIIHLFRDDNEFNNDFGPLATYLFDDNGKIIVKLYVPRELPPSEISQLNGLYNQMEAIFQKYIKYNANHELNLSSSLRASLNGFFNDEFQNNFFKGEHGEKKEYKLYNLMDGVCLEILRLMNDSFGRFQSTKPYKDVYSDDIENDAMLAMKAKELYNKKLPVIRNASSYHTLMHKYNPK
eukprot:441709_1